MQLPNVRDVTTFGCANSISYAFSPSVTGEPQMTQIGLSVVSATSTRSRASGFDIDANAPVIGQMITSTFGAATIASRISRPRQSADGAPPLSTGFDTRRYDGIHSCSAACVSASRSGSCNPAADAGSAMWHPGGGGGSALWAPVPPEMA